MQFFKRIHIDRNIGMKTIKKQSYPRLLLFLITGLAIVFLASFILNQTVQGRIQELEKQKEQISIFIEKSKENQERLAMPTGIEPTEAITYAEKVPKAREIPRFLLQLDQAAKQSGIALQSMTIDDNPPINKDYLQLFFEELTKFASSVDGNTDNSNQQQNQAENPEQIQKQREAFMNKPQEFISALLGEGVTEDSDPSTNGNQRTVPPELLQYIPFGMVTYSLEFTANYQQLTRFLEALNNLPRKVHIEEWSYRLGVEPAAPQESNNVLLTLITFYYKKDLDFIPELPPLEIKPPAVSTTATEIEGIGQQTTTGNSN